jgi:N12 class adenine-specific DNA methylase
MPIIIGLGKDFDLKDPLNLFGDKASSEKAVGINPATSSAVSEAAEATVKPVESPSVDAAPRTRPAEPSSEGTTEPARENPFDAILKPESPEVDAAGYSTVVAAGKGWTEVVGADGAVIRRKGTRAWRNNNPGNIEYGQFAKGLGAIGTDGRFAVFPTYEAGRRAKESLLFDSKGYRDKTIYQAISRYAPPSENNTDSYASSVATAAGVSIDTPLAELSARQRVAVLDAMERVEGFRPGREIVGGVVRQGETPSPAATAYVDPIVSAPNSRARASSSGSAGAGSIVIDETFKPADGLGVFGAAENPFATMAAEQAARAAATKEAVANQFERNRNNAFTERHNDDVGQRAAVLEAENPGRYQTIDEDQLPDWQRQWEEANRSSGVLGDTGRILKSGVIGIGQSLSSIADTVFSRLPGGETFLKASDDIDRWVLGNTLDKKMENADAAARASVTPAQADADAKNWWDEDRGWFGPAWRDPRSYLRTVGESAPGTVVTMLPGGILARGAYVRAMAGGATQRAAAATAARTATLSGAILEGGMAAGDSAKNVRDRIAALPRDQLMQSDAVRSMIEGGMSEDDAIKAVSEDAASQAFLISGVATGMFGGLGDRALAKIIAEGVGGSVARRIVAGGVRGAVAEGILEEAPQGAAQAISENAAVQRVDPNQSLTEGVGEAVASGIAAGGAMGGAMGGAGGAARPASPESIPGVDPGTAAPAPQPAGPIGRAVQRADEAIAARTPQVAPAALAPTDGRPEVGATVRIDADGIEPFMGRIDGYEGDEAVVIDSGSGEIYQIPIGNLTQIAKSAETIERENPRDVGPVPLDDSLPEFSNDPALEPLAPIGTKVTSEGLPPRDQARPATERFPTAPEAGQRVIVDDKNGGRFAATISTWADGGQEAVVKDEAGREYQVPADSLFISNQTEKQVEAEDLKRNPPVEREAAEMTPTRRRVGDKTVELPDEKHARLFDLARERFVSKKTLGASQLDLDQVDNPALNRLAREFGVTTTALGSMADDYRYRVERAGKEARSKLPVKMPPVNERRLRQWQNELAKQQPEATANADDSSHWWDVELTAHGRKQVLDQAGVKRSERVMWQHLTPAIRNKLDALRPRSSDEANDTGSVPDDASLFADTRFPDDADAAAYEAATSPTNDLPEPTQAQKEAGNYKVGRMRLAGLDLSIENPAGSERKGTDSSGKPWSVKMRSHYGYIRGTVGRDKDHIDTFIRPGTPELDDSAPVFVVDQRSANGRFDEHKVMIGFDTEAAARAAYLENYTAGWKGLGDVSPTTMGDFKAWLKSGKTTEPFAPKWFGSRDKADAYVTKQGLQASHEVVENGKRFEVREKVKAEEPAAQRKPAPNMREKMRELADAPNEQDPAKVSGADVREVFRSKGFKKAYADIAASQMGTPHPESSVAYEMARGWLDQKVGRPPTQQPVSKGTSDPIEPYYMGYAAARDGKARVIRASDQEAAYADLSGAPSPPTPSPKQTPSVTQNTVFTEDAAEKARALLRKKLSGNTLNAGLDPEIMQAGITLAGYHIEKGARTFAAYANAMVGDLGETVRPYLKSWYMGVKYDPRAAGFDGMSSAAEVEAADVDTFTGEPDEPAELDRAGSPALEGASSDAVPGTEGSGDARPGAEPRGRADVSRDERAGAGRVRSGRGVADEPGGLPAAAARGQRAAADAAVTEPRSGEGLRSGSADNASEVEGPFGPILRGYEGKWREAALELERRQTGDAIGALNHPDVGPIDLVWGNAGTNQGNGAGLAKLLAWHPEVLGDLQGFINRLHVDKDRSTTRRIQLRDDNGNAGVRLDYDGTAKTWLLTAYETGSRRTERSSRRLSALWGDQATPTPPRTNENISDQLKNVQSAATPAQQRPVDFTITDADRLGEGGQKAKFNGNVKAIKILRQLEEEKRPATRDEQTSLAQWVGWGGLRAAFYREDGSLTKGWEKQAAELKALLTPEEYSAAESSTRNAHYTAPEIVSAVWDIARRLGFRGGQVLEPSVGAGNFLGLMPGEIRDAARVTGVELDRVTGGIAKNLYPGANIQSPIGFEKLVVPDDHFDLAIGNPPFGSEKVYDKERRHLNKLSIHNFFFAKSMEALPPGGLLAMVVTNRFLDGQSAAARNLIHGKADLVAAIRLPNDAFLKNAGTEVTTDIVILRKRMPGETPSSSAWLEVSDYRGRDGKPVPLNRYFIENPEMMLGEFGAFGSMYGPDEPALIARGGQDTPKELARAIRSLPENIMVEPGTVATETVTVPETVTDVQVGAMFAAPDGTIHQRMSDSIGQPVSSAVQFPNDTARDRVAGMVRVRDAFSRLRRAQIDEKATDTQLENLRKRLNTVYDAFVKKHGPINADANKRLFRDDPTWPQISALENGFDKGISATVAKATGEKARAPSADKAAIFTKRTQQPYRRPTTASTAKDALTTVLNDLGRVDLDAMSRLYRKPQEKIVEELGPLLFKTPDGAYVTADAYLSGNVKQKLAEAERAAETEPAFRRNVSALRDIIPADIDAVDIDVKPGSPWLPAKHVEDFLQRVSESRAKPSAFYSAANARWVISVPAGTPAAQTLYGTDRASVETVLNAVLNGQSVTIHDRNSDGSTSINQPATDAANEKVERVKAEWRRWIWEQDARREELSRLYNDTFNTDVQRVYDGSHLSLPGKVGDDIISLRPHQKNFIWRTLQSGTALADHTVGAGKTFAAIASIMEKRRLGQARKPMLAVPNHLVGQWAADFVRLYPGAKVLAATKKDFERDNRKRLFARVATGDWDVVIVAHSSFGKIGMNPQYEADFIQQQVDDLEDSISTLRRNTGEKSRNVAQLTKWRDNLKAKMERLLDSGKKDDGLTFDELGVDALYVDEFHEFKNLPFATGMTRVAGLGNPSGSQKATDMYMKMQFVLEKTGGKNVVTLTGTPLSNTMAEMYTVQRYLDGVALKNLGVSHFDAWARVFGEVVSDWDLSPSGQYKLNSRFAKFVNMPELMQRYLSFADVITNDDIKAQLAAIGKKLPLPNVKGGKPTNITVERSADQASFIGEGKSDDNGNLMFPKGSLVWRAENLPKKAEKGADNMLKVMSDARKAALDMRLIDPSYADYAGSKVSRAADEMKRIHAKWAGKRGTQLVFIDLSTPKKAKAREEAELRDLMRRAEEGDEAAQEKLDNMSPDDFLALQSSFSVYDDLREKLIARGIPAEEIAFIHDANTEAQKEELFGKVRSGRVRLLFGSTPKMGAGTNVQNRLVALHHLDAPWRPSDLEQRDGRGIRQGNELYAEDPDGFEIEILRYATKNTLDARQWQGIEAKARFIQQVRKGNVKTREVEDIAGEAANAAEMKAAASGNPLILEEMETRRKLRQLESQSVEHDREQYRIKGKIRALNDEISSLEARSDAVTADAAKAEAVSTQPFAAKFDGQDFDKPKEFGAALAAAMRKELIEKTGDLPTGAYGDFKISIAHDHTNAFNVSVTGERDYDVYVLDAADVDATGLGMRVINTVKKLAAVPALDRERINEARGQIPALEKQIGPWNGAQDLSETAERHRRIVDALKPKKPGAANAAAVDDGVIQNKRPDPVGKGDGRLISQPAPERREGEDLQAWGRRVILEKGRATGNEYLLALDDDGSVVEFGTANDPHTTGSNNKLVSAALNPDRRIVLYHNHPNGRPLSGADIAVLTLPGLHSVYAFGHDGMDYRASATPEMREYLVASKDPYQDQRTTTANMRIVLAEVDHFLNAAIAAGKVERAVAEEGYDHAMMFIAQRAGIIDFSSNKAYDPQIIPGFDRKIDEVAARLSKAFFKNGRPSSRPDRSTIPVRHVADVAGLVAQREQVAGTRAGATGLSEAGVRTDPPEVGKGRRVTQARVVRELNGRLIDIQPAVLKTIPLNYFTDLARPTMTAVGDYLRVKRLMDAFRGQKHAAADEIAGDWLKYIRLGFMGKDKSKAQELSDLMHDATLAGVDPAKTDEETKAKAGYEGLRKRFLAMSPKGRALYVNVRDAYWEQQRELDDILLDNVRKAQEIALARADERYKRTMQQIRDRGLTGPDRRKAEEDATSAHKAETTKQRWAAKARMTKLRIAFENNRVEDPYFPLGRFGRYFVTVRDLDGSVLTFSKFERAADRDRFAADVHRDYPAGKVEVGVMEQGSDLRRAMDPRIVAEIEEILGGAGVDGEIMDQIWQRYLESMPDLSSRKRYIHRKGTSGYSGDALRVFSSHMFHSAHQLARLKYGLELQDLVDKAFDQAKEADDPTRGVTLANELSKRHEWVMNPTGSKVAQTMTSAAFVWFLAASPAAAAVNTSQTVMLGLPILAARFGNLTKASQALIGASYDSIKGKGSVVNASLARDEKEAMRSFYDSGLIDRTQSHDLAGVGDTGVSYSPLRARVMGVISWAFHRTEVWNREVTALAAYRMARDAGQTQMEAIDTAHDLTWKTHFDYSNSSRPALMQNDLAKVALVFRQHNINMLYRLFRDVQQSVTGETPQARKEARYQLAGVIGMMSLMAGVTGTVGFNIAMAIAGMVLGDDDDPLDFAEQFKADVVDILGPELGGVVLNGVPGHYLGVDLSGRIGMPDLWFRSPTRELQGKDEYMYWLSQTLGATVGLGQSLFLGASAMMEGDVARGIEMAAPKAIRDVLKSYRYSTEGLTTYNGDEILSVSNVSWHDVVAQGIGFTPARIAETYDRSTALKNAERNVLDERQRLVNKWAMAVMANEETGDAVAAIQKFNASPKSAGVPIKKETLQRSIKTRTSNAAKRDEGVLIRNEVLGRRLREALSERIYD